jgi:hypothetical protein
MLTFSHAATDPARTFVFLLGVSTCDLAIFQITFSNPLVTSFSLFLGWKDIKWDVIWYLIQKSTFPWIQNSKRWKKSHWFVSLKNELSLLAEQVWLSAPWCSLLWMFHCALCLILPWSLSYWWDDLFTTLGYSSVKAGAPVTGGLCRMCCEHSVYVCRSMEWPQT